MQLLKGLLLYLVNRFFQMYGNNVIDEVNDWTCLSGR